MDTVVCPHCDHDFETDDMYETDLYNNDAADGHHLIDCPVCAEPFMVSIAVKYSYYSCTVPEYEEYEDPELSVMLR